jgi:tetratricopeptide (TPR) repeat protein
MKTTLYLCASIVLALQLTTVARADSVDDCNGDDPQRVIDGCTALIGKADQSKDNLEAAYVARALAYDNLKTYDKALADLDKAIALDPHDANAFYNRGVVDEHNGDAEAALKDYDKSIALAPNESQTYASRGNANYDLEDLDAALKDYQKAVSLDGDNTDAIYGRGLTYEYLGKTEMAIADFKKVIAMSEDEVTVGDATAEVEKLQKK